MASRGEGRTPGRRGNRPYGVSASRFGKAGKIDSLEETRASPQHRARPRNHHRQHVQRPPSPGPGGPRSGPQAAGHVHRLDRHPRAHALRVGDHRQRRRRGAGRLLRSASRSPCTTTARSRCTTTAAASPSTTSRRPGCPASRWSSPSCTPAASSAAARTTRPAACTASARRWSTRCRPGSTSRSTATPATQRMSFRRGDPGVFDGDGSGDAVHRAVGPAQGRAGRRRASPAPGSGSGRTGRSSPRTPTFAYDELVTRARQTVVPRARAWRSGDPRPARRRAGRGDVPARRRHRRVLRVPGRRRAGHRRPAARRAATGSPRPCRCSTTRGT